MNLVSSEMGGMDGWTEGGRVISWCGFTSHQHKRLFHIEKTVHVDKKEMNTSFQQNMQEVRNVQYEKVNLLRGFIGLTLLCASFIYFCAGEGRNDIHTSDWKENWFNKVLINNIAYLHYMYLNNLDLEWIGNF